MMKTKKVMHLTYTLDTGGAERVIANYAKFHDKNKYMPILCAIKGGGFIAQQVSSMGIKVYLYHKSLGFDIKTVSFVRDILQKEGIDIIHVHNPNPNHYAILSKFFTQTKFIVRTEHNIFRTGRVVPGYPIFNSFLGLFNQKIIGVSNMVVQSHKRKDPLNRGKYVTIYNGIEDQISQDATVNEIKKDLNIPVNKAIVGLVANIHRQKAVDIFLKAAKRVLANFPNTYFVIIGDGIERANMEELSRTLHIEKNVIFTGHREDAAILMQCMDIFTLSSLWEGFPITILEAMRVGIPCVVTDVGGNREAVTDGITGFVVPPQRPDLLAEKISFLLGNPNRARDMGSAGKLRFLENFTAKNMVEKTEQIYSEILALDSHG